MPVSLFWLTRDFRFADNPALAAACAAGGMVPVFVLDAALAAQGAASRWRLERALRAFDAEMRRRSGEGVVVLRGAAEVVLPGLAARLGAGEIHQSDWPTAALRATQARLRAALGGRARLVLHPGHLLIHPGALRDGPPYRVYTPFARALTRIGPERPGPAAPARILRAPCPPGLDIDTLNLAPDLHGGRAALEAHALPAGEEAARDRLDAFLDTAAHYADRDRPDLPATSNLSEYLATGEIGPRTVWAVAALRREADPAASAGISGFLSELAWREFAWHLLIDFPALAERPWRADWAAFPWRTADPEAWRQGDTGIALVDAGLREMRLTGRMHNRVRMVVASWLTKHLLTDWRAGLTHFADSLTDWDPAANAMNWQWVAGCGPDASPFFRIFNPEKQAAQYDPKGAYRRRWLDDAAYHDTLPRDWAVPRIWRAAPAAALTEGRERALAAYGAFRDQPMRSEA